MGRYSSHFLSLLFVATLFVTPSANGQRLDEATIEDDTLIEEEVDVQIADAASPATFKVQPQRLHFELKLEGQFDAENSQTIALRPNTWSKMVVDQAVPHGAAVQQGTKLITLELDDLESAIQSAEHDLVLAELAVRSAEVAAEALHVTSPIEIEAAKRKASEAKDDLDYFLSVTRDRSKRSAEESLKRSQYSLEYAQEELDQLRQMYEADDLTEETEEIILKRAQRSVESAEYSLESAEIRAKRTLETDLPRQEQAQRDATAVQLANTQKTLTSLEAAQQQAGIDLEKKQIELEKAERKVDELREDMETLSSITAAIDGFVYYGQVQDGKWSGKEKSDNYLKSGGTIPAKSVVMTVVPARVSHLRTTVKEADLRKVRRGMAAIATANVAPDDELEVTVESVSRVPVSAGTFDCVLRLGGRAEGVVAGMGGKATLTTYDKPDALLVPKSGVFKDAGDDVVYLAANNERRVVETGHEKNNYIEITRGLSAGDEILLENPTEN